MTGEAPNSGEATTPPADANGSADKGSNELAALQSKNDSMYAEMVDMKKTLEAYSKHGKPDEIAGRLDDYYTLRKTNTGAGEEVDSLVAERVSQVEGNYQSKIEELTGQLTKTQSELKELHVVDKAMSIAASLFNDDSLPLVRRVIKERCDYVDGDVVVYKDGEQVVERSGEQPSQNMGLDEFLGALAQAHPSIAKPKQKSGTLTGAEKVSSAVDKSGITVAQWREMSTEQKNALDPKVRKQLALASANTPL